VTFVVFTKLKKSWASHLLTEDYEAILLPTEGCPGNEFLTSKQTVNEAEKRAIADCHDYHAKCPEAMTKRVDGQLKTEYTTGKYNSYLERNAPR
jgi:hypothetical protein